MENRFRKPTHPGELIREDLLPETGMSQTQLARLMGVSRRTVSEIVNERRRVTPDIAFRLAKVFNSTPEMWLNMQQAVDLWEARRFTGHEYCENSGCPRGDITLVLYSQSFQTLTLHRPVKVVPRRLTIRAGPNCFPCISACPPSLSRPCKIVLTSRLGH